MLLEWDIKFWPGSEMPVQGDESLTLLPSF